MAGLHQLLSNVSVFVACIRSTGGHDKTSPSSGIEVAVEILYPQAIGVGDGFTVTTSLAFGFTSHTRQAKGQSPSLILSNLVF